MPRLRSIAAAASTNSAQWLPYPPLRRATPLLLDARCRVQEQLTTQAAVGNPRRTGAHARDEMEATVASHEALRTICMRMVRRRLALRAEPTDAAGRPGFREACAPFRERMRCVAAGGCPGNTGVSRRWKTWLEWAYGMGGPRRCWWSARHTRCI